MIFPLGARLLHIQCVSSKPSGPCLNVKTVFPVMGIPMLKIRRSHDRLISNMGIPILVRQHLYIEMAIYITRFAEGKMHQYQLMWQIYGTAREDPYHDSMTAVWQLLLCRIYIIHLQDIPNLHFTWYMWLKQWMFNVLQMLFFISSNLPLSCCLTERNIMWNWTMIYKYYTALDSMPL